MHASDRALPEPLRETDRRSRVLVLGRNGEGESRLPQGLNTACRVLGVSVDLVPEVAVALEEVAAARRQNSLAVLVTGGDRPLGESVQLARALGGTGDVAPVLVLRAAPDEASLDLLVSSGCCDCLSESATVDEILRALRYAFEIARRQRAEAPWLEPGSPARGWPPPALAEALRLAGTGRTFIAFVHDLRNLVHPIRGYAEMLGGDSGRRAPNPEFAHWIVRLADQMAELLRRALAAAPGDNSLTDLEGDRTVSNLQSLLRAVAGPGIQVEISLHAPGARLRVREGALEQILLNLAVNSRDAIVSDGRLSVSTSASTDSWQIEVRDSGTGIARSRLGAVLEPGRTTRRRGTGRGLGLWIVRGLVEEFAGSLEIHSEVGVGTRVTVRFPRTDRGAGAA